MQMLGVSRGGEAPFVTILFLFEKKNQIKEGDHKGRSPLLMLFSCVKNGDSKGRSPLDDEKIQENRGFEGAKPLGCCLFAVKKLK